MKTNYSQQIRPLSRALICSVALVIVALPFYPAPLRAQALEINTKESGQPRRLELALDEVEVFRKAEGQVGHLKQILEAKVGGATVLEDGLTHVLTKINGGYDRQRVASGADALNVAFPDSEVSPVLYIKGAVRNKLNRRIGTRDVLVYVGDAVAAEQLRVKSGAIAVVATPLTGVVKFKFQTAFHALDGANTLAAQGVQNQPLLRKQYEKRSLSYPLDEFFPDQWHLLNTGQNGATPGIDINVLPAWEVTKGGGVIAAIVDDCLETTHPDLRQNAPLISTHLHHDFNDDDDDPRPVLANNDAHGTSVGGLLGARQNNGNPDPITGKQLGVSGVAPEVTLLGLRLISGPISDQDIFDSLTWGPNGTIVSVSNNSWGPSGSALVGPDILGKVGFREAATSGRDGKGKITVFAAGNGRFDDHNSNYDGFANSRYVTAVAALSATGVFSSYSEPGANILICAPGGGFGNFGTELRLTTTDVTGIGGYNPGPNEPPNNDYNNSFNGTSSASPITAGVAALILATNSDLGWRDVKEILASTARKVNETNADWITNEGGFHFNHSYGAGLVDAGNAVARAFTWRNLGPEIHYEILKTEPGTGSGIVDNGTPTRVSFDFSNNAKYPNIRVEQIEIEVKITHPSRSDLEVALVSPKGVRSVLAAQHVPGTDSNEDYRDIVADFVNGQYVPRDGGWVFTTTHDWGDNSSGVWTLEVIDRVQNGEKGRLQFSALRLYGSASGTQRVAFEKQRYSINEPTGVDSVNQTIKVVRSNGTAGSFSVDYQTTISTATSGADFTSTSGTLTFADGDTEKFIDIPILPDSIPEDVETVNVVLTNIAGTNVATLGANSLTSVDIVDGQTNRVTVRATDSEAAETASGLLANTGKFTISRSKPVATSLDVFYTLGGTAKEGLQVDSDYSPLPTFGSAHVATIPPFATSVDVIVTPRDDNVIEGTETVILSISIGAGYDLGVPNTAIVRIADNDRPGVQILATDDIASETADLVVPDSAKARFTIKRAPVTENPLEVIIGFGGTQILGVNYTLSYLDSHGETVTLFDPLNNNSVVIPANQESIEVTLTPKNDDIYQATKTVVISMLPSIAYDFSFGFLTSAHFNIIEDDPFPDTKVPTLTVSAPVNGLRIAVGDPVHFEGAAKDNESVERVIYRINRSGDTKIVPITPSPAVHWNFDLDPANLLVGFNTLDVTAIDNKGNESRVYSAIIKRLQVRVLNVATSGMGHGATKPVTPSKSNFEVGDVVNLEAIPIKGDVFGGWSGYTTSNSRKLTFAMPDYDVTMTADFEPNPFKPLTTGAYSGLVQGDAFNFETSGFVNLTIGSTGAASGKLTFSGVSYSFKGEFISNGKLAVVIPRKNTTPIQLQLTLDLNEAGTRKAVGTVATSSSMSSVTLDRAAYSTANPAPVDLVKSYTLIFPPATPVGNLFQDPRGYGVGQMKIDAKGIVKWKGILPDGTSVKQAQALTKDNTWPMFFSLYKKRGVLLGNMNIDPLKSLSDVDGKYNWFKPVLERDFYFPLGFKIQQNDLLGSFYVPPLNERALKNFTNTPIGVANANITINEGSLLVPITHDAEFLAINTITITTPTADALKLAVKVKTGDLSGSFTHAVSGRATTVKGVLFQKQDTAFGFFKGTSAGAVSPQTGYLILEAK